MSRPQKVHKPIKGSFNNILAAVAAGSGKGKRAAISLSNVKPSCKPPVKASEPPRQSEKK